MKRARISRGGQLSVPAEVRKRWGTSTVTVEDHGDHLLIRPAPDDPITAARGSLKEFAGPSSEELRREFREEELAAEERKYGPA